MTPDWLLDTLAAVMLVIAAVSAARLLAARPWQHGSVVIDTDVAHLLMAIAMAGIFTSSLTTLPDTAWEVIFGLMTAWFAVRVVLDARANGVRALAGGHCAPHLVHSAAMLYMFLALTAPAAGAGGMNGMGGMAAGSMAMTTLRVPTLAFLFVLILAGYSVWDLDQLSGRRYGRATAQVALAGAGAAAVPALAGAEPGSALFASPATDPATGSARSAVPLAGPGVRGAGGQRGGAGEFLLSPAVTVGCRITMGVAMVFMLVLSI
jgi:Domain of unknown function (DUF5134)